MTDASSADAIVVGAGVMGSAIALELARAGRSVVVVDKSGGAGFGSTSASSAIIRFTYSTFDGVALAWESYHRWLDWPHHLGAADGDGLARFHRVGMVALDVPLMPRHRMTDLLARVGVPYEDWDADEVAQRIPGIDVGSWWPPKPVTSPEFLDGPDGRLGAVFTPDAGYVDDPRLAAANLADAATRAGASFRFRRTVIGAQHRDGAWEVDLDDGASLRAPVVVNAAGPWSGALNRMVGAEREIPPYMVASRLLSKYNPLKAIEDWLDPRFADQDISLRELLQRNHHSEQAIELAALAPPGISIDGTSVLRMWQEDTRGALDRRLGQSAAAPTQRAQPFGEQHDRHVVAGLTSTSNIEGGCWRLPQKMAEALGDRIRLKRRVAAIDMTRGGGVVRCTDGGRFQGRFIISAIPFTMLRQVSIKGSGGGTSPQAIASMPYAGTARLYLNVSEPFWHADGLPPSFTTDGPIGMFWAIDNHTGTGAHRAMIVMTGPTATAISKMPQQDVEPFLLAELVKLRPAAAGKLRVKTYKDWSVDPLQLGCGFSLAPGQVNQFARTMLKPWDVLHFAGEHTRRNDYGMEAAMESGERAALEVLGRIG